MIFAFCINYNVLVLIFLIFLGVISIILFLWQISNLISVFFGSPYVMLDKKVIRQALKLAGLRKGEILYDLGCGNGQVLIEAAKMGGKAIGFEISPYYFIWAKLRTGRYRNIKIYYRDIKKVNLSKADVVYCYLLPKFLEKLSVKLKKEAKSSLQIISIGFPIKTVKSMRRFQFRGHKIFIYR